MLLATVIFFIKRTNFMIMYHADAFFFLYNGFIQKNDLKNTKMVRIAISNEKNKKKFVNIRKILQL